MGSGTHIKRAIKEDGIENFEKEILFRYNNWQRAADKEAELVTLEIVESDDNYNLKTGGGGGYSAKQLERRSARVREARITRCMARNAPKQVERR
jgi:N-methylhydantoinase B/oxoprolinase/acetone carboxylase alpha subunit